MKATKRKRLEAKGWKIGTVEEFLNLSPEEAAYSLSPEEAAYIELKHALSNSLRARRSKEKLSQPRRAQ
jgi:hypothetical protein